MSINLKANADGTTGAIQLNGVDVLSVGNGGVAGNAYVLPISTTTTLTTADSGKLISLTGTSYTVTLPTGATGLTYRFINDASGVVTVSGAGFSYAINTGASLEVFYNGSAWKVCTSGQELGVGQVWTNVLASRAISTIYTNNSGRPIVVHISYSTGASAPSGLVAYTEGTLVGVGSCGNSVDGGISFVVPTGHTYFVGNNSTPITGISYWKELR